MTRSEQHKLIQELRLHAKSMSSRELEELDMFLKRDKDDEDLDRIAERRLQELADKYIPKLTKTQIDEAWKKMTAGKPKGEGKSS